MVSKTLLINFPTELQVYCLLCVVSQYQAYRLQHAEQQQHAALSVSYWVISQFGKWMNVRTLTSNYKHNVVYTTPEKLSKAKRQLLAASKGGNNQQRHSHRLLSASPLITSQRPTNFSTITEEEEQQCAKPATGNYTLHRQRVYIYKSDHCHSRCSSACRHPQLWPHLGTADKQRQRCGSPSGQCQYTYYNVRSQLIAISCSSPGSNYIPRDESWHIFTWKSEVNFPEIYKVLSSFSFLYNGNAHTEFHLQLPTTPTVISCSTKTSNYPIPFLFPPSTADTDELPSQASVMEEQQKCHSIPFLAVSAQTSVSTKETGNKNGYKSPIDNRFP